jgi:hypothetical protein
MDYSGGGGYDTFQDGRHGSGNNRGQKGARDRLWSPDYGGGLMERQFLDPAIMGYMQNAAMGQGPSAAELLMRAGLGQQQAQAYGMAAGAQGMSPALAMRQAQQAAGQAGLQSQAQFGAMRADEMARAQQMYLQAMLGQQGMNDQAALAREQLLQGYITGGAQTNLGQQQLDDWWKPMLGQAVGGAVSGLASGAGAALMKP